MRFAPRIRAFLLFGAALVAAGCSIVDNAAIPRTYDVNVATAQARDDSILLNIVRASEFEPLNFVTLSKYTGTQTLGGGIGYTGNEGVNAAAVAIKSAFTGSVVAQGARSQFGPNSINGTIGGNFDSIPLENKEFYAGFLSPIDLTTLHILLSAGLTRELVLHAVVKAARVTKTDGSVIEYFNDPADDHWSADDGSARQPSDRCVAAGRDPEFQVPYRLDIWNGHHERDCQYQKFLVFLRLSVRHGLTTEVQAAPRAGKTAGASADKNGSAIALCYDPALARLYRGPVTQATRSACGREGAPAGVAGGRLFETFKGIGAPIKFVQPELRSAYGVFQYYGGLLRADAARRVRLISAGTPAMPTGDNLVLTVNRDGPGDCFARAYHHGEQYCVPARGAGNTKEAFVLLNTLVTLSTTRSALPATTSVLLQQ